MNHRLLGRTGIRVSPFTLGCMMFNGPTSTADSCDIIDHAIDAGINFLDTANVYSTGGSEIATGEALKRNGHRDRIVLATKCHGNMHKEGVNDTTALHAQLNPNRYGNSRRQIIEQCDASLKRLQTDYIDLYQIHRPHPECAIDETLRALDDLVRSGKVRYLGSSTFAAWQLIESLWASERHHLNRFVTEQPPYNLMDRRIERELIPACRTHGIGLIPWSPLASGFLTGKYRRGGAIPAGSRFDRADNHKEQTTLAACHDVIEGLETIANRKGCTLAQLALAWCRDQPGITSPIIGPRTLDQLKDNLGAMDVTLDDDDRQQIDELCPPGEHTASYYSADWSPSVHRF